MVFTLNLDKCKLLVLPERKSDQVELGIDGSQVKATDNVELLGVVIDGKLNFKNHISKLIANEPAERRRSAGEAAENSAT